MTDPSHPRRPPPLLEVVAPDGRTYRFSGPFDIGRDQDCEVQIADVRVSRRHARVMVSGEGWSVCDLQSSNGILVDGRRVDTASIGGTTTLRLGADGPSLELRTEAPQSAQAPAVKTVGEAPDEHMLAGYAERYFGSQQGDEAVGPRTLLIRKAFEKVQKKQRRSHRVIVAALVLLGTLAGGYAFYAHQRMARQEAVAQELFYSMKAIDMEIAGVEQKLAASGQVQGRDEIRRYMEQRRQLESSYDQFVATLYDRKLTEEDKLILRITRTLGECELAAPPEYLQEVKRYIKRWQSTDRFAKAVRLSSELGYTKRIVAELGTQNLPPQFFYLAMQESDFIAFRSGPQTRWGIAKGMWQFIPETGSRYGLKIGPLSRVQGPDAADERQNWEKATNAAARYIKDIYGTDAQASGLLVMASYNWGEQRVIDLLKTMPANPRERNFWQVLAKHRDRLPLQTYDYVFNIVAAAVIGENPRLFGFPFDNPLAAALEPS